MIKFCGTFKDVGRNYNVIPADIDQFHNLEEISICCSGIKVLPTELCNIQTIKIINIRDSNSCRII